MYFKIYVVDLLVAFSTPLIQQPVGIYKMSNEAYVLIEKIKQGQGYYNYEFILGKLCSDTVVLNCE